MATIVKRGENSYQVKIRKAGYPSYTKTFDTRREAVDAAAVIESEMNRGVFQDRKEAQIKTLGWALLKYKDEVTPGKKGAKQENRRIDTWLNHPVSEMALSNLLPKHFSEHRDSRLESGVAPATIRLELALISIVINTARTEWGVNCDNPIQRVKMPRENNSRERRLSELEYSLLIETFDEYYQTYDRTMVNPYLKPMFILAIETAMRFSELAELNWDEVHLKDHYVILRDTKNGKSREVPLSETAVDVFEELLKRRKDNEQIIFRTTYHAIYQAYKAAIIRARKKYEQTLISKKYTKAEIQKDKTLINLTWHDLRHEAISRMVNIFDIATLMKIVGHSSTNLLNRYYQTRGPELAKLMRLKSKKDDNDLM